MQHTWLLQKRFSNILEEPQIMEYFSCKMEGMLLFFMLMQIREETLASKNPQLVYSLSNTME